MPHSHHSHSGQFCRHAKGSLDEVLQAAVDQKFEVFGLSEHAPRYRDQDLYPEESDLTPSLLHSTFLSYLSEAHSLRKTYSSKLSIPIGLETDFISSSDLVGLDQLLKDEWRRIDYLVGSVHHVSEIPIDFDRPTFDQALASFRPTRSSGDVDTDDRLAWTSLLGTYFDNQFELMEHYQPEVIGHFDLVRLWKPELKFADFEGVWDKVRRNVEFAVGYGALFELNAAAFRKGWDEAYPASDVLDLIVSLNGRLCLSDDSHGPLAVGLNYHRLHAYVVANSLTDIWYLSLDRGHTPALEQGVADGRKRSGRVTPRKAEGWLESDFWVNRT